MAKKHSSSVSWHKGKTGGGNLDLACLPAKQEVLLIRLPTLRIAREELLICGKKELEQLVAVAVLHVGEIIRQELKRAASKSSRKK